MPIRLLAFPVLLASFFQMTSGVGAAQAPTQVCQPSVTSPIVVVSPAQRVAGGAKAQPPITDTGNGFDWPDTPLGIVKTGSGYEFFGSDGRALAAIVARAFGRQQQGLDRW